MFLYFCIVGCATPENVKLLLSFNSDAVRTPNCFGKDNLPFLCKDLDIEIQTILSMKIMYP